MKQAFYLLYKQNILRAWQQESTFLSAFRSLPGCQTCMCKRGISFRSIFCYFSVFFSLPPPGNFSADALDRDFRSSRPKLCKI